MKNIFKRAVCGTLSAAVTAGSMTLTANLAGVELMSAFAEQEKISLVYGEEGKKADAFSFDLDHYVSDSYSCTYSPELAHILCTLSAGAYSKGNTEKNLTALGFTVEEDGTAALSEKSKDANVGYTIGTKKAEDGTDECIIIISEKAEVSADWVEGLSAGYETPDEKGLHSGYKYAADAIIEAVPMSCGRYIVTGHGEGGAVGSIVAQELTDGAKTGGSQIAGKVYDYNFAVPDTLSGDSKYINIFNINNALDPVCYVTEGEAADSSILNNYSTSLWFADDWDAFYGEEDASDVKYHSCESYAEYLKTEPGLLSFRIQKNIADKDTEAEVTDHLIYTTGDTVTITGTSGLLSDIVIPEKIGGKPVTAIATSAFSGREGLKSVVIPKTVTSIGSKAFSGCTRLSKVNIPEGVTEIGEETFDSCSSLTEITIPATVETIGNSAFKDCTLITKIELPDSVTSVGELAFYGCSSLKDITIPDSVTAIEGGAFAYCRSLETIEIPDSVTKLGFAGNSFTGVFQDCVALKNVKLPANINYIGHRTFYNCSSLEKIDISAAVRRLYKSAFSGCSSLTGVELPECLEYIGQEAFKGCSEDFKSITVNGYVSYVGLYALGYSEAGKISDFVISGYSGSMVETYAKNNGMTFKSLGNHAEFIATTTVTTTTTTTTTKKTTTTTTTTTTTEPAEEVNIGDVNNDGSINLKDVVMLRRYIAGGWGVELDEKAADVNGDGAVNLKDAVTLRRYIAGGWNVELKSAK